MSLLVFTGPYHVHPCKRLFKLEFMFYCNLRKLLILTLTYKLSMKIKANPVMY